LFEVLLVELEQVLGAFYDVVDLVVRCILDDDSVVEVQVVVETEHIHSAFIDEVGLV
jgi:hypothetical protein